MKYYNKIVWVGAGLLSICIGLSTSDDTNNFAIGVIKALLIIFGLVLCVVTLLEDKE